MKSIHLPVFIFSIVLILGLAACTVAPAALSPTKPPSAALNVAGPTSTPTSATLSGVAGPTSTPLSHAVAGTSGMPSLNPVANPALNITTSVSGDCVNAYFPIFLGTFWIYSSTGSSLGDYTFYRTVEDVTTKDFIAEDDLSTGDVRFTSWSCDNGLLGLVLSEPTGIMVSSNPTTLVVNSGNATGYVLPTDFTQGNTYGMEVTANGSLLQKQVNLGDATSKTKIDCTNGGSESVTVAAGTFDTFKVTCHITSTTTLTTNGKTAQPIVMNEDVTQWYALAVGMVKSVSSGDLGNETVQLNVYYIGVICRGYQ
jgi:hypothetical protein